MMSLLLPLACSGPGAGPAIAASISIGYYCAGLAALITTALFFLYRSRGGSAGVAWTGIVLLLLHPAWTISATHGDCGVLKLAASGVVSLAFVVLLLFQVRSSLSHCHDA